MFRISRPSPSPEEVYSSSLATLHLGHALLYPEPHKSGEPQIGDVGFFHHGAFVRLFNLDTSSPEKKVTFWPTPFENIEPLPPGVLHIDSRRLPFVPGHYCSHGVERREVNASADVTAGVASISYNPSAEYTCKAAKGAVLTLRSEAYIEKIFGNNLLEKYILRNHDNWYAYVKNIALQDVEREDLVFVSGWVKTTADWMITIFQGTNTHSRRSPEISRHGEGYLGDPLGETKRHQCLFVSGYKVRRRFGVVRDVASID
ncbi:uncharacterized protein PHACADRAFT_248971 [Phanerochaete carnosa HHB-10118-sp]|uniref:Uncharacterized protein n=1 Tax=Phanerochaete carnosa (strain HHB-10118-sp) TaxID=650164 RepID=K5V7Y8_PHACS|nr:uncharacterized protein PHACADRAFT_248971 [Phanerochaete carnosa HHB-10118-sp]EKM58871.1 hypothetical protein PHACADRAFT_248971 [Phanerochaete carnosa HHB-10118-sp]